MLVRGRSVQWTRTARNEDGAPAGDGTAHEAMAR
jgi:hypothetical protein